MIVILDMQLQSEGLDFISNWVGKIPYVEQIIKILATAHLVFWLAMIPLVLADLVTQLFKLKVLDFSCPAVQLHSNPNEPKPSFNAFKKQQKTNSSNRKTFKMWLITLISWRITNTLHLTISSYEHFDYHYWLLPCHATLPSPVQRQSSSRQRDPTSATGKLRNMATKKLWKWHAIAAIPHLLRLLFLHLGARAPKTSQLMTHRSPQKPPPKPWTKVLYQTGTKASCTVLSHNQDSILWRNMIAFHIYSTDPPMFAQRLHTLVEND